MTTPLLQQALEALKEAHDDSLDGNDFRARQKMMFVITAIQAHLSTSQAVNQSLTDAQSFDLLTAALYISAHEDEGAFLRQVDAERIAELLLDLSGYEPPAEVTTKEPSK